MTGTSEYHDVADFTESYQDAIDVVAAVKKGDRHASRRSRSAPRARSACCTVSRRSRGGSGTGDRSRAPRRTRCRTCHGSPAATSELSLAGGDRMAGRLREPCPITTTVTKDTVWIPKTAARGWLILTRDSAIRENRAEVDAVRESGAHDRAVGQGCGPHLGSAGDRAEALEQDRGAAPEGRSVQLHAQQEHVPIRAADPQNARPPRPALG